MLGLGARVRVETIFRHARARISHSRSQMPVIRSLVIGSLGSELNVASFELNGNFS